MIQKPAKILISGYYGFNNFGDDAILYTLLSNIKSNSQNFKVIVISNNPDKVFQDYKVDSISRFAFKDILTHLKDSDLFISGGGSLLQDVTSWKSLLYYLSLIFLATLFKVKTYIYAQGVGPINSDFGRFLTKYVLKNVDMITVRDIESKSFLKNLEIDSTLTADPVWCINLDGSYENIVGLDNSKIKVGIQLRDWYLLDDHKLNNLADALSMHFANDKYQLVVISLQDLHDLNVTRKFKQILKSKDINLNIIALSELNIFRSISLLSQLDYLIAMRYHACLTAFRFNVPTLPICYDPKVEILSKEADIQYLLIEHLNDKEELRNKINSLIDLNSEYKSRLKDFSAKKELESRQNEDLLIKILMHTRNL